MVQLAPSTLWTGGGYGFSIPIPIPIRPTPGPAPGPPAPRPSPPAEEAKPQLGELLSPSQVRTWMDCPAKGMFHYVLGLPERIHTNLAIGLAVHEGIGCSMNFKLESGEDLPTVEVQEIVRGRWNEIVADPLFNLHPDQDAGELGKSAEELAAIYMREAAPSIQPIAVEMKVTGEIAGVRVRGKIDILDENGVIHDTKTCAQTPSDLTSENRFQMATYVALTPGATGEVQIDSLVKLKKSKLVQIARQIDQQDMLALERLYPQAQKLARSGVYRPNRTSMLCSKKNCSYWRECEAEYGGHVEAT